jgi:hypothetical protein
MVNGSELFTLMGTEGERRRGLIRSKKEKLKKIIEKINKKLISLF